MIPKVIHYCWFGKGKYPRIVKKCINSWKEYCSDYEIKLWNEDNYDVYKNDYVREAYQSKKWAFVSDFARLDIIYNEGGIYLDTDVELIKSMDNLLDLECFLSSDGSGINTGIGFGASKNNDVIHKMMELYSSKKFMTLNGPDLTPCTQLNTLIFLDNNYDISSNKICEILGTTILPPEYFSPITGSQAELKITSNTIGIHWGSRLWETGITKLKADIRMKLGGELVHKIKKIVKNP